MKTTHITFFIGISAISLSAGCTSNIPKVDNAQYWQRANPADTTYINGPKAQQLLNRDIARCVTELRELERLGQIKNAIPVTPDGRVLNPDELAMREVDTPERDGYLFAEHKNYSDFEGCMDFAGWERTRSLTYDMSLRAEHNFFANHVNYKDMRDHHDKGEDKSLDSAEYND